MKSIERVLPTFPEFVRLSLDHKDALSAIVNKFPTSDFNFVGLFTWDIAEVVMVSQLYGNIVFQSSDYLTHKKFYSFIGDNNVDETTRTLLAFLQKNSQEAKLLLIPHSVAKHIQKSGLHEVIEDRDNHDYILSVRDLVEFRSSKFRGKKNLLNRFRRTYGENAQAKELDLDDSKVIEDITNVIERWRLSRSKQTSEIKDEIIGINKALTHHKALGMRAFGVYHDTKLIGFTLFEILPTKVAVIHFDKADVKFEGIFEHMKHNFAKHLATLDVEAINYEQDLGIEGLRRAKESYHPVGYVKKYTVKPKI